MPSQRNRAETAITLDPAWLRVCTPGLTWQRLHELHLRSLGDDTYGYSSAAKTLEPRQAFALYATTLVSVLGHIAVASEQLAERIMDDLNAYATSARSLDGLESPFLSAFEASFATSGATAVTSTAAERWRSLGQPLTLGGGALQTPILAAGGVIMLVGADNLARALHDASDAASLHEGIGSLFRAVGDEAGSADDEALETIGYQVLRAAVAIAGAAEIQNRVKAGRVVDPDTAVLIDPQNDPEFETVRSALVATTYAGQPLLQAKPSRQFPHVVQGAAIVVEVGTLGNEASAEIELARAGAPLSIAPELPVASGEVKESSLWRPTVEPVAAMTGSGPGIANSLHQRSPGLALSALPRLTAVGDLLPRGLLASLLEPPLRGSTREPGVGVTTNDAGELVLDISQLQTTTPVTEIIDDVGVGHEGNT